MSTRIQNTIIRASAGTGKTYQLAARFLALLLLQSRMTKKPRPERIVAMTFTRMGAGEFTRRILRRLAESIDDPAARQRLQQDLDLLVEGDPKQGIAGLMPGLGLKANADVLQSTLAVMVDQFDRLSLSTIDSFMARSVQTLAFELGVGGFEILKDSALDRQRDQLLGKVFDAVGEKDLELFYQTLKKATLKSASSLKQELDGFVKAYHRLHHALPERDAWGGPAFWDTTIPTLTSAKWQEQAATLAAEVERMDFGHKSIAASLQKALDWIAVRTPGGAGKPPTWLDADGTLLALWADQPDGAWVFESYKKPRTLPPLLVGRLKAILAGWIHAEHAALSGKTEAIYQIVHIYEQLYEELARGEGRLSFDDLPLLLDPERYPDDSFDGLSLLGFRWYQKYDHWLLDEFQDTSRSQWNVLKPWIDEVIQDTTGTMSVFVVGDPKQSIYGWRGGEPRLFDELSRDYPGAFKEQIMAESRRSRPAVLELVNHICSPDKNPMLAGPAFERWSFQPHVAESKRKKSPGYAAVLLVPEDQGDAEETDYGDGDDAVDKLAPQARAIKTVLDEVQPLKKGLSCAILVRKGANGQALAQWLRTHGVPEVMMEGDATLAAQSPVVAALVDALKWIAMPGDSQAAGHISLTPLWSVLTSPVQPDSNVRASSETVWQHWRERITQVGAAVVTHEWCSALAAGQEDPYARYCLSFVSQRALQVGAEMPMADWLAELSQLSAREAAGPGTVHVMTIHKAKGLDFDIVFLPDLDGGVGGKEEILVRRDDRGVPVACLAYPAKWLQSWSPVLGEAADAQKADQDLESMCVLYVGLTRAKEATFVLLSQKKPRTNSPLRGWILAGYDSAIPGLPVAWGGCQVVREYGAHDFLKDIEVKPPSTSGPAAPIRLAEPVPRRKRSRPSDEGHAAFAGSANSVPNRGMIFGTAVHEVFEQVGWWSPSLALSGDKEATAVVQECLSVPEILDLFTSQSPTDEVLRELPLEFMEGEKWWTGIMDRLVLRKDTAGQITRAVVIDFKTDHIDTLELLRERYQGQLDVYRRALAAALHLDASVIEIVLLSTHLKSLLRIGK